MRYRSISNDAEPEPMMTAARSTTVGTPLRRKMSATSPRERRCAEACRRGARVRPGRRSAARRRRRRRGEVERAEPVDVLEGRLPERVDQVVDDVDAAHGLGQALVPRTSPVDDLDPAGPRHVPQPPRRRG